MEQIYFTTSSSRQRRQLHINQETIVCYRIQMLRETEFVQDGITNLGIP